MHDGKAGGDAQLVKWLLNKHEDMSSIPAPAYRNMYVHTCLHACAHHTFTVTWDKNHNKDGKLVLTHKGVSLKYR